MIDAELGELRWNDQLEWWEGRLSLPSETVVAVYVLCRPGLASNRRVTLGARSAINRLRWTETECRNYSAQQLVEVRNSEWSRGEVVSAEEFARRLVIESIEVHESGYAEMHFGDGGLFDGHGVGVRIRPDGTFQEAVLEG